jgi:hypothetical protein
MFDAATDHETTVEDSFELKLFFDVRWSSESDDSIQGGRYRTVATASFSGAALMLGEKPIALTRQQVAQLYSDRWIADREEDASFAATEGAE